MAPSSTLLTVGGRTKGATGVSCMGYVRTNTYAGITGRVILLLLATAISDVHPAGHGFSGDSGVIDYTMGVGPLKGAPALSFRPNFEFFPMPKNFSVKNTDIRAHTDIHKGYIGRFSGVGIHVTHSSLERSTGDLFLSAFNVRTKTAELWTLNLSTIPHNDTTTSGINSSACLGMGMNLYGVWQTSPPLLYENVDTGTELVNVVVYICGSVLVGVKFRETRHAGEVPVVLWVKELMGLPHLQDLLNGRVAKNSTSFDDHTVIVRYQNKLYALDAKTGTTIQEKEFGVVDGLDKVVFSENPTTQVWTGVVVSEYNSTSLFLETMSFIGGMFVNHSKSTVTFANGQTRLQKNEFMSGVHTPHGMPGVVAIVTSIIHASFVHVLERPLPQDTTETAQTGTSPVRVLNLATCFGNAVGIEWGIVASRNPDHQWDGTGVMAVRTRSYHKDIGNPPYQTHTRIIRFMHNSRGVNVVKTIFDARRVDDHGSVAPVFVRMARPDEEKIPGSVLLLGGDMSFKPFQGLVFPRFYGLLMQPDAKEGLWVRGYKPWDYTMPSNVTKDSTDQALATHCPRGSTAVSVLDGRVYLTCGLAGVVLEVSTDGREQQCTKFNTRDECLSGGLDHGEGSDWEMKEHLEYSALDRSFPCRWCDAQSVCVASFPTYLPKEFLPEDYLFTIDGGIGNSYQKMMGDTQECTSCGDVDNGSCRECVGHQGCGFFDEGQAPVFQRCHPINDRRTRKDKLEGMCGGYDGDRVDSGDLFTARLQKYTFIAVVVLMFAIVGFLCCCATVPLLRMARETLRRKEEEDRTDGIEALLILSRVSNDTPLTAPPHATLN